MVFNYHFCNSYCYKFNLRCTLQENKLWTIITYLKFEVRIVIILMVLFVYNIYSYISNTHIIQAKFTNNWDDVNIWHSPLKSKGNMEAEINIGHKEISSCFQILSYNFLQMTWSCLWFFKKSFLASCKNIPVLSK